MALGRVLVTSSTGSGQVLVSSGTGSGAGKYRHRVRYWKVVAQGYFLPISGSGSGVGEQ